MDLDKKEFYYIEWKIAEIDGNIEYASVCKEKYRQIVIESLKKPYTLYIERFKAYPMIYLN